MLLELFLYSEKYKKKILNTLVLLLYQLMTVVIVSYKRHVSNMSALSKLFNSVCFRPIESLKLYFIYRYKFAFQN